MLNWLEPASSSKNRVLMWLLMWSDIVTKPKCPARLIKKAGSSSTLIELVTALEMATMGGMGVKEIEPPSKLMPKRTSFLSRTTTSFAIGPAIKDLIGRWNLACFPSALLQKHSPTSQNTRIPIRTPQIKMGKRMTTLDSSPSFFYWNLRCIATPSVPWTPNMLQASSLWPYGAPILPSVWQSRRYCRRNLVFWK